MIRITRVAWLNMALYAPYLLAILLTAVTGFMGHYSAVIVSGVSGVVWVVVYSALSLLFEPALRRWANQG